MEEEMFDSVLDRDDQDLDLLLCAVPLDVYTSASIGNCKSLNHAIEVDLKCINVCNSGGWTALMYAAYYGHLEAVGLLHSMAANLHARNNSGHTALMLATMCGHNAVVEVLIKFGILLEVRDQCGWTAVFHAVHSRHSEALMLLLRAGANANACDQQKGDSPLLLGCMTGDVEIVELLLASGADPRMPDYKGTTPYTVALHNNNSDLLAILLKSIKTREQDTGRCGDLASLLSTAGLSSYEEVFQEQAVNLHEFLTLTDEDLKECGVSKLGPRRKMTSLIARWHCNAPLRANRQEAVYADKLQVEMKEMAAKLAKTSKDNRNIQKQLSQERDLRASTESLVVEARARVHRCHELSVDMARKLCQVYSAVLNAADYVPREPEMCKERTDDYCQDIHDYSKDEASSVGINDSKIDFKGSHAYPLKFDECIAEDDNRCQINDCISANITETANPQLPEQTSNIIPLNLQGHVLHNDQIPAGISVLNSQTIVADGSSCSYLNYVDNVRNFNIDKELNYSESSATNLRENLNKSKLYSDSVCDSCYISVDEGINVLPDIDSLDLKEVYVPKDYRERSPKLHIPKLGHPLKECLEIVQKLTGITDPNVPRPIYTSEADVHQTAISATNVNRINGTSQINQPRTNSFSETIVDRTSGGSESTGAGTSASRILPESALLNNTALNSDLIPVVIQAVNTIIHSLPQTDLTTLVIPDVKASHAPLQKNNNSDDDYVKINDAHCNYPLLDSENVRKGDKVLCTSISCPKEKCAVHSSVLPCSDKKKVHSNYVNSVGSCNDEDKLSLCLQSITLRPTN